MPITLQEVLGLLNDGKPHRIDELQKRAKLSQKQARETMAFLTEYGFSEMDKEHDRVKISQAARKLLEQENL